MKYGIRYEEVILSVSTSNVDAKRCTSITFENYGDDDVILNQGIKINAGTSFTFDNMPNEVILSSFKVQFLGVGIAPQLLVIKKFVEPIN
jgi:hypothetical protein